MESGTSGFLSISDSDRRVPSELGPESQASSCLRKGTPLAPCRDIGCLSALAGCYKPLKGSPFGALGGATELQKPDSTLALHWLFCESLASNQASLVAQRLKRLPAMQETWVRKITWRRKWQPTPVFLPMDGRAWWATVHGVL